MKETRAVRQWAEGVRVPSGEVVLRVRTAYHAAALLREKDSVAVVQAWFQGMNPRLNDVSPARLLREGEPAEVGPLVLAAARAFAAEDDRVPQMAVDRPRQLPVWRVGHKPDPWVRVDWRWATDGPVPRSLGRS